MRGQPLVRGEDVTMIQFDELNLTLADLRIDDEDRHCFELKDDGRADLTQCARQFLDGLQSTETGQKAPTHSAKGPLSLLLPHSPSKTMSSKGMLHAFEQVVDYATRREVWERSFRNQDDPFCFMNTWRRFVYTYYTFDVEQSCYDGGSGGTDMVTRNCSLVLEYTGTAQSEWAKAKSDWARKMKDLLAYHNDHADRYGGPIKDEAAFIAACKQRFGYHGTLANDGAQALPNPFGFDMTLLDPFGLPGVYEIII